MDYQIIWTPRSLSTLQELVEYVAERNPDAARRLGGRILNRVELLRKHPFIAEVFHPLDRVDIRDYPVPPARLIYRVHQQQRIIYVLASGTERVTNRSLIRLNLSDGSAIRLTQIAKWNQADKADDGGRFAGCGFLPSSRSSVSRQ